MATSPSSLPDEAALRAFVEGVVGGRVARFERSALGSSRVTYLVDVEGAVAAGQGGPREWVLRCDSGDGPLSGTEIDLAREAVFYRALAETPVRIPRLRAAHPSGRALLVERAPGSESLAKLDEEARTEIARDLGRALAELHALDPAELALPGVAAPADPAEHALLELRRWQGFLRARVDEPQAVVGFAIDWLGRHAPARVGRTAVCHGDAGAGNFLHDGARVTALLDWEFAHLGDPLGDLAWVQVRSHLLGGDDMRAALDAWSQQAGQALDRERIVYHRALVLLRMAISCEIGLASEDRSGAMDRRTYALLLPYLAFLLPPALREAGCHEPGLAALEDAGRRGVADHPVLRAAARELPRWEAP